MAAYTRNPRFGSLSGLGHAGAAFRGICFGVRHSVLSKGLSCFQEPRPMS